MNIRARRLQIPSVGHFVCMAANEADFKGQAEATLLSFAFAGVILRFKVSEVPFILAMQP